MLNRTKTVPPIPARFAERGYSNSRFMNFIRASLPPGYDALTSGKIIISSGTSSIQTSSSTSHSSSTSIISITGGGEDKRPIVEFEFEFAGSNYGKIEFGLDNRDRLKTDVLLNRKTMKLLNVMVNPSRKYVVTTKFSVEGK